MFLTYLLVIFISNFLGLDILGYFTIVNSSILIIGSASCFGTNISIIKLINQKENKTRLVKGIKNFVVFNSLIISMGILFFHKIIEERIFGNLEYASYLTFGLSIITPVLALTLINQEYLKGIGKINLSEIIRVVFKNTFILILIPLIYLLESTDKIRGFLLILLISVFLNYFLSYLFFRSHTGVKTSLLKYEIVERETLILSFHLWITNLSNVIRRNIPVIFLTMHSTVATIGVYNLIFKYGQIVTILGISSVALIGREVAKAKDLNEIQSVLDLSSKFLIKYSTIILIILLLSINLFFKLTDIEKYNEFMLLAFFVVLIEYFSTILGNVSITLNMLNKHKFLSHFNIILTVVMIISSYYLIKFYDIYAALIISSISNLLVNLLGFIYLKRELKISTIHYFK